MDVAATSGASAISEATQARKSLAGNFDTFLTLLTTQLRNQDPLDPLETNEFTQQLVQFTSVEQQIAANENLEKILAAMQVDQTATALNFLGKQIDAETDTIGLVDGGTATWTYTLPSNAQRTVLTVTDETGKLVHVADGATSAGTQAFTWDGMDNAGNPLPPGPYTLSVAARDADGGTIETTVGIRGVVDGASSTEAGEAALLLGGVPVPLSAVTRVTAPPATPDGNDDDTTRSETTADETASELLDPLAELA